MTKNTHELFTKRYGNFVLSGAYSCRRHFHWTHGGLLAGERTGLLLLKERYGFDELDATNICDIGTEGSDTVMPHVEDQTWDRPLKNLKLKMSK